MQQANDITRLLRASSRGDANAREELVPLVYDELRRRAGGLLREERSAHTLQATALVHEAFLQIFRIERLDWNDRVHFFSVASRFMRRILVDYARARKAAKRDVTRMALDPALGLSLSRDADVLRVDEALARLAELDPRHAEIVMMRFFAGMSVEEVAAALDTPKRTLEAEWTLIRAWLWAELSP